MSVGPNFPHSIFYSKCECMNIRGLCLPACNKHKMCFLTRIASTCFLPGSIMKGAKSYLVVKRVRVWNGCTSFIWLPTASGSGTILVFLLVSAFFLGNSNKQKIERKREIGSDVGARALQVNNYDRQQYSVIFGKHSRHFWDEKELKTRCPTGFKQSYILLWWNITPAF